MQNRKKFTLKQLISIASLIATTLTSFQAHAVITETAETGYLTEAAADPTQFVLGAAGATSRDPVFNTLVMRLTDDQTGGSNTGCTISYSFWPIFNKDSTLIAVRCNGYNGARFFTFDPVTFKATFQPDPNNNYLSGDMIWSANDPNIIYSRSDIGGGAYYGPVLNSYNIPEDANGVIDVTKITTTVQPIKNFTSILQNIQSSINLSQPPTYCNGETSASSTGLQYGLNEMSRSMDDNVWAFTVVNSYGCYVGYLVWQRNTDTIFQQISTATSQPFVVNGETVHAVQIDKSGQYLTVINDSGNEHVWDLGYWHQPSVAPAMTAILWGSSSGFIHEDTGPGTLLSACGDGEGVSGAVTGICFRQLSTPQAQTSLLPFFGNWNQADVHLSMLADDNTWGLVTNEFAPIVSAFEQEIYQVATDPAHLGKVRRLVHHYSTGDNNNCSATNGCPGYALDAFGNISRDGRFIAWSSDWGTCTSGQTCRTDVYIAKIIEDSDGDGLTDDQEIALGTDPLNNLDPPRIGASDTYLVGVHKLASDVTCGAVPCIYAWDATTGTYIAKGALPSSTTDINAAGTDVAVLDATGIEAIIGGLQLPVSNGIRVRDNGAIHCALTSTQDIKCINRAPGATNLIANGPALPVQPLSNSTDLAVGIDFVCAIDNNVIKCWGDGIYNNLHGNLSGQPAITGSPIAIAAGDNHLCAIEQNGANTIIECWGDNSQGQQNNIPTTLAKLKKITAGSNHTCVINGDYSNTPTSLTVSCWGNNSYSQTDVPYGVYALVKPVDIRATGNRTCAVQALGASQAVASEIKCWPVNVDPTMVATTSTDSDGDGISDAAESAAGTNPWIPNITVTTTAPLSAVYNSSFTVAATSDLPVSITTSGGCSGSGTGSASITMTSSTIACTVIYNQAGDVSHNAATQVQSTTSAAKANQTITPIQPLNWPRSSLMTVTASTDSGLSVTISKSSGPGNNCTYQSGGTGSAIYKMASGGNSLCVLQYTQNGNTNYNAATNNNMTISTTGY